MGLFFAAIGAYDGYQYSDTYPGYGKVAKNAQLEGINKEIYKKSIRFS